MTADERLEALLNRAGQTISDLPTYFSLERVVAEFDPGLMEDYIYHLTDVIDRMETALENVIGERDWLKKRMQQFKFDLAICTEGGVAKGYEFRKGDIYPILGDNNGIQICYEDKGGDANVLMCHTWDCFAPICEDAKFIHQDGTIPPLFERLSRDFESAPEDWRADE